MKRLIRMDWAIKKILRDKANFDVLEGFLTELLGFNVTIQEVLESESNQDHQRDKFNRVDLLVRDDDQHLFIVEIQNQSEVDYLQRMIYGASKAMVEHMQLGAPYSTLKKVYSVSIIYFDLGQGEDYLYHGVTQFVGKHSQETLGLTPTQQGVFKANSPTDLCPEYFLIKVPKFDNQIRDRLDEWIYFLKNETLPDNVQAKGLREARQKLDVLNMDEQERNAYNSYLEDLHYQASMVLTTFDAGKVEGKVEGIAQGMELAKHNTAKQALPMGLSIEDAAQLSGLSVEKIQAFIQDQNKPN